MIPAQYQKFPFVLDRNLAKANSTENQVRTSCDIVVLGIKQFTFKWYEDGSYFSFCFLPLCSMTVYIKKIMDIYFQTNYYYAKKSQARTTK